MRSALGASALETCATAFETELDFIQRALRRHGINDVDAQDLTHETFLVMWRRWGDYDAERPLRPWLAGIAYRIAYHHRARVDREVPAGFIDREDETANPESRTASTRERRLVHQALATLPEKQRAVLVLHELEGVEMREIAALMNIPLATAYSRLRVGRKGFATAVRRSRAGAVMAGGVALRPEALLEREREDAPVAVSPEVRRRALSRMRAAILVPGLAGSEPGGAARPSAGGLRHVLALALPAVLLGAMVAGGLALPARHPAEAQARPAAVLAPARALGPRAPRGHEATLAAVLLRAPSPRDPAAGLGSGLVGYWRFDDGAASTVAHDLSGYGNDCAIKQTELAAGWTEGQLGGAITLGGQGWLACARVDALNRAQSELTIALWVKRAGKGDRVRALVTRQLDRDARDVFHFGFRDDLLLLQSSVWGVTLAVPFPRATGRWVHVAGSLGRDRRARIYIDGREVGSKRTSAPTGERASTPLIIGAGINAPDQVEATERFEGALDELVVYERALGAGEIAALAAGAQPALSP
jgi:RNA polymerase sigma-70 factor (ECF subfamily)